MFRDVTTLFADPRGLPHRDRPAAAPLRRRSRSTRSWGWRRAASSSAAPSRTSWPRLRADPQEGQAARRHRLAGYTLEYGEAMVEIHDDAIAAGERVLLVDDLLATGGTAEAGIKLIERLGGRIVGCAFIIDLPDLGGRGARGCGTTCMSSAPSTAIEPFADLRVRVVTADGLSAVPAPLTRRRRGDPAASLPFAGPRRGS